MTTAKAAPVARIEAKADHNPLDIPLEFEGITYRIPPSKIWPMEAIEAAEDGRGATSIRLIVGDDQYKKLRESVKTLGDFQRFSEAMQDVTGGNL